MAASLRVEEIHPALTSENGTGAELPSEPNAKDVNGDWFQALILILKIKLFFELHALTIGLTDRFL